MADMDVSEKNSWLALIEETSQALSTLHAEELEALAERAAIALKRIRPEGNPQHLRSSSLEEEHPRGENLREVAARHRALGDLLQSTASNLAVLRRLRDPEADSRWER